MENKTFYINSFKEFISPIDGTIISSTQQLRDHEKRYNVVQVGNDYKPDANGKRPT